MKSPNVAFLRPLDCQKNYDFLVATTSAPAALKCDYVNGVPFLMGIGTEAPQQEILRLMEKE